MLHTVLLGDLRDLLVAASLFAEIVRGEASDGEALLAIVILQDLEARQLRGCVVRLYQSIDALAAVMTPAAALSEVD